MHDALRKAAEAEFIEWLDGYIDHLDSEIAKALGVEKIDPGKLQADPSRGAPMD